MVNDICAYSHLWKWLDKRIAGKPAGMQTLQRRTMNTATSILTSLRDVPFTALSYSLFFICKDADTGTNLPHEYEKQLELAGANPDRFAQKLHSFYNEMTARFKKENCYEDFFDFLTLCSRMRYSWLKKTEKGIIGMAGMNETAINCYYTLLLQQLEYLRPNKYDLKNVVIGKSIGEKNLLTVPDACPTLDLPAYELERKIRAGEIYDRNTLNAAIQNTYAKYGYKCKSGEDIERLSNIDRIFGNIVASMSAFINEYNSDMLPQTMFNSFVLPLHAVFSSPECPTNTQLRETLRRRNKMLPANGAIFDFQEKQFFHKLFFKETLYDDSIVLLYRFETECGDISGYYDTRNPFFYTAILDASDSKLYTILEQLVLYLYACATRREGAEMLAKLPENFCIAENVESAFLPKKSLPISCQMFLQGGKPKVVYNSDTNSGIRKNDEKYESVERPIQGFVRKLGAGRSPSAEAVTFAESLGLILATDETYVRPFIRHVLKLREKTEKEKE